MKVKNDPDTWRDLEPSGEAEPILVESYWFDEPLTLVGTYGWEGEYPIYWDLMEKFAHKVRKWVESDHQAVIVVNGATGTGKSNWGINFARTYSRDWNIHKNLLYSFDDFKEKLADPHPDPVTLFDEGSLIFNSLDTLSKDGKGLSVLFDMIRSWNFVTIITAPADNELNKRIMKHADYYVECPSEAPLPGYSPRGFFHVRDKTLYRSGKVWENLLGTGIFPPISSKMNTIYQKIKKEKQLEYMRSIGVKI